MIFYSYSPAETEAFAAAVAKKLCPGDVIAFNGGLGAGKTTFTRGLASILSPNAFVSSPTFALVNDYGGKAPFYHFDMYRISDPDDLYFTGFYDYLENGGILAIEWSENIDYALPENTIRITLERISDNERKITVEGGDRFEDIEL